MTPHNALLASTLLSALAAANPQWGGPPGSNGGAWGAGGPFAAFPSCASSCKPSNTDWSSPSSLCADSGTLSTLNTCVDGTSCSDDDKNDIKETIAQLCVNAGASITQSPYNTYSVTSGKSLSVTGGGGSWAGGAPWSSWASANGFTGYPTATSVWASWASANDLPTATADWPSWASSHGWGGAPFGSLASEFSSWTAAETITAWPTAASEWSSFTSAHPVPSDFSGFASWASANGFPGGSAWPTAWTTNSAWASAVSAWSVSGGPGWHGGPNGPFGGPLGGGPWSSGPWESGAWTEWWGTNACPPSTWSGWTAGPWSTDAPWTSWTACSATATASSVYEITTTNAAGSQITSASTSYGYQLEEAGATSTTSGGAAPTNMAFVGSAAGMLGVLAGAVLL